MAREPTDVEILVHIAAPSRTADDITYRRLAQAYLSFSAGCRTEVSGSEAPHEHERGSPAASAEPPPSFQPPAPPSSSQSQEYATAAPGLAFGPDSQDLSFQSAWGNRSSPRLAPTSPKPAQSPLPTSQTSHDYVAPALSSFCAPPSQISDSYPLPDPSIMRDTPTRILQRFLNRPRASTDTSTSPSPSKGRQWRRIDDASDRDDGVDVPSSFPAAPEEQDEHSASRAGLGETKVIPVTPLVPHAPAEDRKRKALGEDEHSMIDITHISSSVLGSLPSSAPSRAESEPLPSKKARPLFADVDALSLLRSSSDTGLLRSSNVSAVDEVANTLEIRPTSPPVGIAHIGPEDLITERLAKLALDLSSRYHATEMRAVEPLERGYWQLDCSHWSPERRLEAWVFLTNYLHKGLAGWGVWCRRDAGHVWLRLYCWGCVVKHTYLLLYLASARQIKTTGARWIGSDGEVALEVAPRDRRS